MKAPHVCRPGRHRRPDPRRIWCHALVGRDPNAFPWTAPSIVRHRLGPVPADRRRPRPRPSASARTNVPRTPRWSLLGEAPARGDHHFAVGLRTDGLLQGIVAAKKQASATPVGGLSRRMSIDDPPAYPRSTDTRCAESSCRTPTSFDRTGEFRLSTWSRRSTVGRVHVWGTPGPPALEAARCR